MNYITRIYDMILNDNEIPKNIKQDVLIRVQDWYGAGKSLEDDYIKRQYEYLMRSKQCNN